MPIWSTLISRLIQSSFNSLVCVRGFTSRRSVQVLIMSSEVNLPLKTLIANEAERLSWNVLFNLECIIRLFIAPLPWPPFTSTEVNFFLVKPFRTQAESESSSTFQHSGEREREIPS